MVELVGRLLAPTGKAYTSPVKAIVLCASVLVLPLALLLFGQWPLRDWVQAWSREANDAAQVLFAIYIAAAVTAASRADNHLAAFRTEPQRAARWRRWALLGCIAPWALFTLWTAAPQVLQSVLQLERFPDSFTAGYFLIKLAAWLLAALALIDALVSVHRIR